MVIQKFDLTPLMRSTIGFDRLADMFDDFVPENNSGFPPYNIERIGDNSYVITMAVAGFGNDDLDLEVLEDRLVVRGKINREETTKGEGAKTVREYLHRGVAERSFERQFSLADHVKVIGATLNNGLLNVSLERILPESKLPRKIQITNGSSNAESNKKLLGDKATTSKAK